MYAEHPSLSPLRRKFGCPFLLTASRLIEFQYCMHHFYVNSFCFFIVLN
jgi:hypothetical protein